MDGGERQLRGGQEHRAGTLEEDPAADLDAAAWAEYAAYGDCGMDTNQTTKRGQRDALKLLIEYDSGAPERVPYTLTFRICERHGVTYRYATTVRYCLRHLRVHTHSWSL